MTNDILYIVVAGSMVDGLPVPLIARTKIQDCLDYIKKNLKYYSYEWLKIYSVTASSALSINVIGDKIFVQ